MKLEGDVHPVCGHRGSCVFPYPVSGCSRTGCLIWAHIDKKTKKHPKHPKSMYAQSRQPVREPSEHRIWKYAGTPMAADWMNWFLGVEGVLDLFDLGDS